MPITWDDEESLTSATTSCTFTVQNGGKYVELSASDYKNFGYKDTIFESGKQPKSELKFKSKLGQIIFNDLFKELSMSPSRIGLFSGKGSELFDEATNISHYYELKATSPDAGNIALQHFDVCIIDDVIDRMESTMRRGNVIKEALKSLHKDNKELLQAYLIIFSKKMDKEELESIALFAGARKIIDTKCLETLEHTCIITM
jgi:hypothetical protein